MHAYHSTMLYNKTTEIFFQENGTGQNTTARHNKQKNQTWIPPPEGWYKWNIDVSRLESTKTTTISYVFRDTNEKLIRISRHSIGGYTDLNGGNLIYAESNQNKNT